jgi:hypothetical protein
VEALGRVLRLLVARGVFAEPEPGTFMLGPTGRLLEDGAGFRAGLDQEGFGGRMDRAWPALLDTVRAGRPCYADVFGAAFWEDLAAHPEIARSYDALMAAQSESIGPALAECFDWSDVREVVDVGGGTGTLLASLARAHPRLRGTVVDLPATAGAAAQRFTREGLAGRCRALGGSMFDALPKGADVYLLCVVIGDWDDAQAAAVLARCAEAAGVTGRVLIVEALLEADPAASAAMDLQMLVVSGGRARTLEELRTVIAAAGLELVRRYPISSGLCVLECAVPAEGADRTATLGAG